MKIKTVNIESDVEAVLRNSTLNGNNLLLPNQLDRNLYTKTMKVLEKIGFKWNKSLKCHVGDSDSAPKLQEGLDLGKVIDEKQTFQFFETPVELAETMCEYADVEKHEIVLEPSAGKGAIIKAIFKSCPDLKQVYVCELEPKMNADLKLMPNVSVIGTDFLQCQMKADKIVMNPPFCNGQDIEHVRHAYELLNENGRIVAITSRSWCTNSDKKSKSFRTFIQDLIEKDYASYWNIEEGAFKESGTQIGTVMMVLRK